MFNFAYYLLEKVKLQLQLRGELFTPVIQESTKWATWLAMMTKRTCADCANLNGKTVSKTLPPGKRPPVHPNCRCILKAMLTILAGTATIDGINGADYILKKTGILPPSYLTKEEAEELGWISQKGNLREILPDAVIGGDVYENRKGRLPEAEGRVWYEADINYFGGYRGGHRLLYSNDGLIFITFDHYLHFYELV